MLKCYSRNKIQKIQKKAPKKKLCVCNLKIDVNNNVVISAIVVNCYYISFRVWYLDCKYAYNAIITVTRSASNEDVYKYISIGRCNNVRNIEGDG